MSEADVKIYTPDWS